MPKITHLLKELPDQHDKDKISLYELMAGADNRSLPLLLLILTAPNIVPFINVIGITHITGVLLLFFTAQLIFGAQTPWLPQKLLHKQFDRTRLKNIFESASRKLHHPEKWIKPRLYWLSSPVLRPLYGLVLFGLTLLLLAPIPLMNVPVAFCMMLLLLGLVQKDGLFILLSLLLSAGLTGSLIWATITVSLVAAEKL